MSILLKLWMFVIFPVLFLWAWGPEILAYLIKRKEKK